MSIQQAPRHRARARRLTPGVPALLVMMATGFSGVAILLPTAPLWVTEGGADASGAGLVNAVLMLFTVVAQSLVPLALRRVGWGPTLVTGMLLLGLPSLPHLFTARLDVVLALSAVRGLGFGILTVCGSAALAELVEPSRRGRAVGLYGLAIGAPQFLLVSGGAWLAENVGFWLVFTIGVLPLLGVPPAIRLARRVEAVAHPHEEHPHLDGGRLAVYLRLLPPVTVLLGVTIAGGALISFAPQMSSDPAAAAAGLMLLTATSAVSRWRVGALADRYGTRAFMWPLVAVTAAGLAVVAWAVVDPASTRAWGLLAGMGLVGVSYGALQSLTLVAALAVVRRRHTHLASAVWNIGFDTGTGLGSLLVGYLAAGLSFPAALLACAVLSLATVPMAILRPHRPM